MESQNVDVDYVNDLALCAINTEKIYLQSGKPCVENLRRRIKNGTFKEELAPKLFELGYLTMARKEYERMTRTYGQKRMSKEEKAMFGKLAYQHFQEEIKQ